MLDVAMSQRVADAGLEELNDMLFAIADRLQVDVHAGDRAHPAMDQRTITATWLATRAAAAALAYEINGPPEAARMLDAAAALLRSDPWTTAD